MRICYVTQEYPPDTAKGGIAAQTIVKATQLAHRGHDVHVITRAGERAGSWTTDGVHIQRLIQPKLSAHTEIADWVAWSSDAAAAVAALHAQNPIDLVEFPEWACEGYVHLLNRTEWYRPRTIISLHGPLVMFAREIGWPSLDSTFYRVGKSMEAFCLEQADGVYTSSQSSLDWCAREHGIDTSSIQTVHSGVDIELFHRQSEPAEQPTVVYAGRIAENKGVLTLLKAVIEVSKEFPSVRLILVGRGDEAVFTRLTSLAREANFSGIEFRGFVTRESLAKEISSAHVFAAPSYFEGGPVFANLEAMACGLPVVACRGTGAADVIKDGVTGLLVPPREVKPLAKSISRLLQDPVLSDSIGQAAKEYVVTHASTDVCIDRLENLYREFISDRS